VEQVGELGLDFVVTQALVIIIESGHRLPLGETTR
jgi:hypothetical protein